MNWKKFAIKSLELIELIAQLEPSAEEKKQHAMQDAECAYDSLYYSGRMSYGTAEACKDAFRHSLGLEKKY